MANAIPVQGSAGHYFARVGTFVLIAPPESDLADLFPKVAKAIRDDSRVVQVAAPELDKHWMTMEAVFPAIATDIDDLLVGSDVLYGVRYPQPFAIEVSVPVNNQPKIHGETAVAERYFVAWDGWTAVVLWERKDEGHIPAPAGQVVIDILQDAAKALDLSLYVQACSPGCELKFAHTGLIVDAVDGPVWSTEFETDANDAVKVEVVLDGRMPLAPAVHHELVLPATNFSEVKNVARRILNLEAAARRMTSELIQLDYMAVSVRQETRRIRARAWLHNFLHHRGQGGPRRAKYLIACLWLAMASIEVLQRRFAEVRRDYEDTVTDWAVPELFDGDLKSDEADVESVDAQFARAAIDYKSLRIDTRVVVVSTIVAGLAGGVLGLVAALLTLSAGGGS